MSVDRLLDRMDAQIAEIDSSVQAIEKHLYTLEELDAEYSRRCAEILGVVRDTLIEVANV